MAFAERVAYNLPYEPNGQQIELIAALARFCSRNAPDDSVFLLNGYAGTGKTSLTGALVKTLAEVGVPSVLLAPTGRAAKVFAAYARHPAYTIHRMIYRSGGNGMGFSMAAVAPNRYRGAVFVVDEASMVGMSTDMGNNLLEDLIHYVYTGDNCRLILLGDSAQLPPVGYEQSPALSVKVLRSFGLRVSRAVLTQTVRQASGSGILYNATWLRRAMRAEPLPEPRLKVSPFDDVITVDGEELPDAIGACYTEDGEGETVLITRSNRRAVGFNMAIRSQILGREELLSRGERLLVAKNNYYWSREVKGLDFIANGDVATVTRIYGTEEKWGMTFADVTLHLSDHDIEIDTKIFLSSLTSEYPGLPADSLAEFYEQAVGDPDLFAPDTPMSTRERELKKNPYINALLVKYAYAVTCHKAQGGQWKNVFVDLGYIPPESMGLDFYRWLYTAVTRARESLYLVNPAIETR
ncbi:MAG: AAA family ATPase [Muribaculaceae bacterium]